MPWGGPSTMCMSAVPVAYPEIPKEAAAYFIDLQARICSAFEALEDDGKFSARPWSRPEGHRLQGGGTMRQMRGRVFEKVGVNVSHVWGTLAPQFKEQTPGAAAGSVAART